MSLTRREMCLLFPSALLPALLVTKQTQEQSTLPSVLYPFDKLPLHISTTAATCAVLKGKLDTGEYVEVHEATLPPRGARHPPHRPAHAGMCAIREGAAANQVNGRPTP